MAKVLLVGNCVRVVKSAIKKKRNPHLHGCNRIIERESVVLSGQSPQLDQSVFSNHIHGCHRITSVFSSRPWKKKHLRKRLVKTPKELERLDSLHGTLVSPMTTLSLSLEPDPTNSKQIRFALILSVPLSLSGESRLEEHRARSGKPLSSEHTIAAD